MKRVGALFLRRLGRVQKRSETSWRCSHARRGVLHPARGRWRSCHRIAVPWDPAYETGHPDLDAQFRALLEICARLADHAPGAGLDEVLAMFKAQVRALFRAEDERLSGADDDLRDEHDHDG